LATGSNGATAWSGALQGATARLGSPAGLELVAPAVNGREPGALTNDLSATQTQILNAAGQAEGRAMPPTGLPAAAHNTVLRSVIKAGLLEVEEGAWAALRITSAGCRRLAASLQASRGIRAAATRGLARTQGWSRTSTEARPRLCQMSLRRRPSAPGCETRHLVACRASLAIAYALAFLIGWNREKEDRSAGLRTFPLVAVAACGFILAMSGEMRGDPQATARVVEGVITGIGFIGGGAILKGGGAQGGTGGRGEVHGTATAAALWATGAIGVAVGLNNYDVAVVICFFTVATLYMLGRFKPKGPEG
jgi:putative Mg2+ transporter-C (MgtC) family protein